MLFNSLDFIIFAIIFFALWPWLRKQDNIRWGYITLASFVFYGWWDWRFLFLIIGCGVFNYICGEILVRNQNSARIRKLTVLFSIIGNISVIAIFKYLDFTVHNLNWLLNLFGYAHEIPLPSIILPVGISFYTFQAMSYTLDIYRGELKPARNILHFMAYLSCFPQLVAGPIVRAADFMPQLERPGVADDTDKWEGLKLIVYGYTKKCLIADNLAPLVNAAFLDYADYSGSLFWWITMIAFAFQIYGDFSGYSDIARGLARWMGYSFILNFNHPYVAYGFRDFWSRWHISLSTWFKDYVYIPLGGNRCSRYRANMNMLVTMVISGLWHGASWNFIIWGGFHGILLWIERTAHLPDRFKKIPCGLGHIIYIFITFALVCCCWVFFRAETLKQAVYIMKKMFSFSAGDLSFFMSYTKAATLLLLCIVTEIMIFSIPKNRLSNCLYVQTIWLLFLAVISIYFRGPGGAFIYFQF